MIKLFCAAQGVEAEVILPGFDSIEQTALDPSSSMYKCEPDIISLIFSEYWLQKYIGNSSLVEQSNLESAQNTLSNLGAFGGCYLFPKNEYKSSLWSKGCS